MYRIAQVDVRHGAVGRFGELMQTVLPLLEQHGGWRLDAAYTNVVGRVGRVLMIFEIPDANAIPSVVAALRDSPAFADVAAELSDLIVEETTSLVARAPFSP